MKQTARRRNFGHVSFMSPFRPSSKATATKHVRSSLALAIGLHSNACTGIVCEHRQGLVCRQTGTPFNNIIQAKQMFKLLYYRPATATDSYDGVLGTRMMILFFFDISRIKLKYHVDFILEMSTIMLTCPLSHMKRARP